MFVVEMLLKITHGIQLIIVPFIIMSFISFISLFQDESQTVDM
jgi:hypothetical protein